MRPVKKEKILHISAICLPIFPSKRKTNNVSPFSTYTYIIVIFLLFYEDSFTYLLKYKLDFKDASQRLIVGPIIEISSFDWILLKGFHSNCPSSIKYTLCTLVINATSGLYVLFQASIQFSQWLRWTKSIQRMFKQFMKLC